MIRFGMQLLVRLSNSKRGRVFVTLAGGLFFLANCLIFNLHRDYLLRCVTQGNVSEVRRLLNSGVPSNASEDESGVTALMIASRSGNLEMVQLLLNHGANPNTHDTYQGTSPLLRAVFSRNPQVVEVLLAHGANPDDANLSDFAFADKQTPYPQTYYPLLAATDSHDAETVRVLLRHGASIKVRNGTGQTALDIAIQGHDGTLKQILRQAAQAQTAR